MTEQQITYKEAYTLGPVATMSVLMMGGIVQLPPDSLLRRTMLNGYQLDIRVIAADKYGTTVLQYCTIFDKVFIKIYGKRVPLYGEKFVSPRWYIFRNDLEIITFPENPDVACSKQS